MNSYTTIQGDTFDQIAKRVYGNERRMDILIEANPRHMKTVVFSAGEVLTIPGLPAEKAATANLPPWRK